MENQCMCRKLLSNPKNLIIWSTYAIIVAINLSLCIGSYMEYEPKAGRMFGIITAAVAVVFGLLARRMTRGVRK